MNKLLFVGLISLITLFGCNSKKKTNSLTQTEKILIRKEIEINIALGLQATRNKDINTYMNQLPDDLLIYDESGEVITKAKQKEYVLRDWTIIDTTLNIKMDIDSIHFLKLDSIFVFTFQRWERMMFQHDGITTDTVVTTQRHRETWKKRNNEWLGYEVKELGGKVFVNGEFYLPE